MNVTYAPVARRRVAILHPIGTLGGSSYQNLIAQAWAIHDSDIRHLIVDLSDVEHISTAGMVGLYAVARLAQDTPPLDLEAGWEAIRALVEDRPIMLRLAVVNPRPLVRQTLGNTPFNDFLTVHSDLAGALAVLA